MAGSDVTSPPAPAILAACQASHGEIIPQGEQAATDEIARLIVQTVRAGAQANGTAQRDAHPKMHGCVKAEFRVLDGLPAALRAGVFAAPRSYEALIRFSNGSPKPQPDSVGDGRGMAIKLLGVADSVSHTQDFICINHPAFFVRNALDYVEFQSKGFAKFVFGLFPPHLRFHEAWTALSIARKHPKNPLNIQYWSMTPYLLGESACKFSARPAGTPSPFIDDTTPDFLRDNMVRHLDRADATFDFLVQLRTDAGQMPVEDPTIIWPEAASPFIAVARITIPGQAFDTPERRKFGEALSYTPWHATPAHRPLGGINRVRRTVYETISGLRHQINHEAAGEPTNQERAGGDVLSPGQSSER